MKDKRDPDTLFILGISLTGVSVVFITAVNKAIGLAFLALGIIYMGIGIKRSKKRNEHKKKKK